jgi:hypothetical protein
MPIINVQTVQAGLVGVLPSLAYIETNDPLATVLTTGYLNHEVANGAQFSLPCIAAVSTKETPTSVARIGWFAISHVAANWSLVSASSPAAGVVTLPTIANHIAIYTDIAGSLGEDATTAINGGNIQAGLSGTAGTLISFPTTAANGSLIISALNAGGAFNTTIRNSVMGQSTVYSLGDIGAATGGIVVATSAIRMKSVAGAAAAGGAAAQSFTDAFCTSGSNVVGNWNTQANAASVLKIVPGNGSFVVTSSADAGVGTFNYIITK